jgi:glycopeptide antibiotics resistance protein
VLLVAYTGFVLVVTWWPSPQSTHAPQWETTILDAIRGIGIPMTMPVLEALANVGMFVPLGMLLVPVWSVRLRRRDRAAPPPRADAGGPARAGAAAAVLGRTVLTGMALTILIETVQLGIPGRYSTVQDVVMNTIGAALGGGAVLLARQPWRG